MLRIGGVGLAAHGALVERLATVVPTLHPDTSCGKSVASGGERLLFRRPVDDKNRAVCRGTNMKCPRCKLPLRSVQYEAVDADMCNACWGFWLDCGELESVVRNSEFQFTEDERAAVLDIRTASSKGPTAPAPCPKCGKIMERVHYDSMIHLVIDRCEGHGVWLDTGEIKKVQALAARSEEYHKLLLTKLGVIPQA